MSSRVLRNGLLAAFLLVMLAYIGAGSTSAAVPADIHSSCWASGSRSESVVAIARQAARWSCSDRNFSIDAERVLLRFDIAPGAVLPRYLLSRRSAFEAVHLLAIDRDGTIRQTSLPAAALPSSLAGGYFKASLPKLTPATRQIVVAVDLPTHRMTLERAYLAPTDPASSADDMRFLLVLAGLAGMLVMPLIFNAAFYRALREPFVLWHSALTLSLLMTILVSSGLSVMLFDPSAMTLSWMTTLIFGMTVASGTMFTYHFIEPGLMHPSLRRLLPYCAGWAICMSVLHASFPFVARPIQSSAYTAAFAPIMTVFLLSLVDALRRGSRAAKFQAVGYAPMILVGLIRLVTGILPWSSSTDAMLLFYVGCTCEVLFTTLGMADRFVTMRRERDRARTEADLLERLSETDPLTGLLNRRAIERQFDRLRTQGFAALAVLDLDHFKAINDINGHAVGDAVLKAVASAFQTGPNVRAYRLGGEEFVLLLRGDNAAMEAELRRQAIPMVVANAVPGLDRPVTASMGITPVAGDEGFAEPYERADTLLYEAKRAGRNRTRSAIMPRLAREDIPGDRAKVA
ncbi:sensor domain-containing diguanylate cyclase [Sphingomonas kyeonggiensis]|uniref:diguanylate cyclase n=1 Tax=Sphingomonas kyeonggiensis TaxID=1268553 RepID=A0A7W6JPJ6_9SPHN|nr:diguanylate cyclase [Sphingomonas kyeonggiensis]MBB4097180.1 diguanylate cyclase (GGDEF)-like protein [Sphingomonas kyeonggiensis]